MLTNSSFVNYMEMKLIPDLFSNMLTRRILWLLLGMKIYLIQLSNRFALILLNLYLLLLTKCLPQVSYQIVWKLQKWFWFLETKPCFWKKICIVYQHFLHLIAISETDNKWCMIEANLTKSTWTTVIPNIHKWLPTIKQCIQFSHACRWWN